MATSAAVVNASAAADAAPNAARATVTPRPTVTPMVSLVIAASQGQGQPRRILMFPFSEGARRRSHRQHPRSSDGAAMSFPRTTSRLLRRRRRRPGSASAIVVPPIANNALPTKFPAVPLLHRSLGVVPPPHLPELRNRRLLRGLDRPPRPPIALRTASLHRRDHVPSPQCRRLQRHRGPRLRRDRGPPDVGGHVQEDRRRLRPAEPDRVGEEEAVDSAPVPQGHRGEGGAVHDVRVQDVPDGGRRDVQHAAHR
mmetsp:Transcript_20829/g.50078  ORF Transcript_20829/g.50078 Transcript_20829/m.50078 type:complete len:254 (-) Transcript_20829:289-1050(-)